MSDITFYQNPSSGSRVLPCGQTGGKTDRRMDVRTGMTTLIVTFRNFANAPNKLTFTPYGRWPPKHVGEKCVMCVVYASAGFVYIYIYACIRNTISRHGIYNDKKNALSA
jgi:hypothetical protein